MEFPKVLSAARKAKGAEWTLAEALLAEIGPRGSEARFAECVEFLHGHGIDYSAKYLRDLHGVARDFSRDERSSWLTPAKATVAGSPAVVKRAEADKRAKAAEAGVPYTPPSFRELEHTRKVVREHARRKEGRAMPTRKAISHVAEHATESELGRVADVLKLESQAEHARMDAKTFMKTIAGTKLTAAERRDLLEDVDTTIKAWKWVREAVENPLADEIDDYLRSLS